MGIEYDGALSVAVNVSDLPRAIEWYRDALGFEGRGVRFEGDTIEYEGMVRLAAFFDPDGNRLMLAQNLAVW